MVIDLAEHRLKRQLRFASVASNLSEPRKHAPLGAAVVLAWRQVSPSADLMVDPRNGARAVIRDTGAADAGRFLWSVLAAGEMDPMSDGALMTWRKPSRLQRRHSVPAPRGSPVAEGHAGGVA